MAGVLPAIARRKRSGSCRRGALRLSGGEADHTAGFERGPKSAEERQSEARPGHHRVPSVTQIERAGIAAGAPRRRHQSHRWSSESNRPRALLVRRQDAGVPLYGFVVGASIGKGRIVAIDTMKEG